MNTKELNIEGILDNKHYLDSTSHAIKLARESGVSDDIVNELIADKSKLSEVYESNVKEVLQFMLSKGSSFNVLPMDECWCAIKYSTKKGTFGIEYHPVAVSDLHMLELDPSRTNHLSLEELKALLPAIINEEAVMRRLGAIEDQAHMILSGMGIDLPRGTSEELRISAHACKRWVQRKLGIINDVKAEEYRRMNYQEVYNDVLTQFQSSRLVWTDDGGIGYWIDDDNISYVVGNGIVITLYEQNFGFSKDINRSIINAQLEVVKNSWDSLKESEKVYYEEVEAISRNASRYDNEITLLEAKSAELKARKSALSSQREVLHREHLCKTQTFDSEFYKLFRRQK